MKHPLPRRRWLQSSNDPAWSEIRTRLGMAPNHRSFRAGVLRTHLLSALHAAVIGDELGVPARVYPRFDDTDEQRTAHVETDGLLREIQHIAQIPLSRMPPSMQLSGPAIFQSQRRPVYLGALHRLDELGLVRQHENTVCLYLPAVDQYLAKAGVDPTDLVTESLVNVSRVPIDHPRDFVPLLRADGTPLWHLATVVDDVELGVNLVVRGTDKMSAVAIQERLRWIISEGRQTVSYIFVPRLLEVDRQQSRVAQLLASNLRAASLRWYLAEPFCKNPGKHLPSTFLELVSLAHRDRFMLRDAMFDLNRLAAIDRKMSGQPDTNSLRQDLIDRVGQDNLPVVDFLVNHWRRPLAEQLRLYYGVTREEISFDRPPDDADVGIEWLTSYLAATRPDSAPHAVRWLITGCVNGPAADDLLQLFPKRLLAVRLKQAQKVLS